jgi:hypothetical protein
MGPNGAEFLAALTWAASGRPSVTTPTLETVSFVVLEQHDPPNLAEKLARPARPSNVGALNL